MTDARDDSQDAETAHKRKTERTTTTVTGAYKLLGQIDAASGVGVLGQNDAASGTPIGVQGCGPERQRRLRPLHRRRRGRGRRHNRVRTQHRGACPGCHRTVRPERYRRRGRRGRHPDLRRPDPLLGPRGGQAAALDPPRGHRGGRRCRGRDPARSQRPVPELLHRYPRERSGSGATDGASAIAVWSANTGFIDGGRVSSIETGLRFEARGSRVGPLDNTVLAHRINTVTTGIELFANGDIVQGTVIRNATIFDAETSIHVHAATGTTSDRATLIYFDGVTVHGSTNASRNVHEILGRETTRATAAPRWGTRTISSSVPATPRSRGSTNRPASPHPTDRTFHWRGSPAIRSTRSRSGYPRHRRRSITRNRRATIEWSCRQGPIPGSPSHTRSR